MDDWDVIMFVFLTVAICAIIYGAWYVGCWQGRLNGYNEAKDHYNVMLMGYSKCDRNWEDLGSLYREGPVGLIADKPCNSAIEHKSYCEINHLPCNAFQGTRYANRRGNEKTSCDCSEK